MTLKLDLPSDLEADLTIRAARTGVPRNLRAVAAFGRT